MVYSIYGGTTDSKAFEYMSISKYLFNAVSFAMRNILFGCEARHPQCLKVFVKKDLYAVSLTNTLKPTFILD